jgi:hypothetical protein
LVGRTSSTTPERVVALKSLLNLWRELADELASFCHTSTTRDLETITRRVEHEGLSFLTITLPTYSKDLERSLDEGRVCDDRFLPFKKGPDGLPLLLGGFLRNVFDEHGVVRDTSDAMTDSIFALRQLTRLFAKIELPCTTARDLDAVKAYVVADQETGRWDEVYSGELLSDFSRVSRILFGDVLSSLDRKISEGSLTPKHGPGAVSERLRGNAKFDLVEWPERLEAQFSYGEWGIPNPRYYYRVDRVQFPPEDEERPARVILVPKTMKTPRVIAAEPAALQWMQQALARELVVLLEQDPLVGMSLTRDGMVGFSHQTPNQKLASEGSKSGSLATLDLSEASDRVSLGQVQTLLACAPWTSDAMMAARSLRVQLPSDGGVLRLKKFASMGSALCFPVEAMAFLAAVFVGIERQLIAEGRVQHLTRRTVKQFQGAVRVYGDDIIIPTDYVDAVSAVFAQMGWKINGGKSFWTGKFRESCGGDFYDGADVTPAYLRRELPTKLHGLKADEAGRKASLVAFRNNLYQRGLWRTAHYLDKHIRKVMKYYPLVHGSAAYTGTETLDRSPLLGQMTYLSGELLGGRFDDELHRPLVRGYVVSPTIPASPMSEEGALLKCLLASYDEEEHLLKAGRPVAVDLKLRWATPF